MRLKRWRLFVVMIIILASMIGSSVIVLPRLLAFKAAIENTMFNKRVVATSTSVNSDFTNALRVYQHPALTDTKSTSNAEKPAPGKVVQPTPTVTSANPGVGGDPSSTASSGQTAPIGNISGWRQIFSENFNTDVPIGSFPGSIYGSKFTTYPDGTPDTAGQQGAPSRYYPSKVASVSNGFLDLYLHTDHGTPMAAAILPTLPGTHLYGKYTVRFRSDALAGFKTAWLLWPSDNNWPSHGEIDFPENDLAATINAFMHHRYATQGNDQDAYTTTATDQSWHIASIEWTPNKVNYVLDGQSIGTSTALVPADPMTWVIQTESCLPTCPVPSTAGHLQIDWISAYTPA